MRPHVLINCVLKGFCIVKVSSPLSCIRMMLCRVKRVKALEERSCLFLAMLIAIVMYILQIKSLTLWCIIILYSGNKIFFVISTIDLNWYVNVNTVINYFDYLCFIQQIFGGTSDWNLSFYYFKCTTRVNVKTSKHNKMIKE